MSKALTLDQFRELTKNMEGSLKIVVNFDTDYGNGVDWATSVKTIQDVIMIYC